MQNVLILSSDCHLEGIKNLSKVNCVGPFFIVVCISYIYFVKKKQKKESFLYNFMENFKFVNNFFSFRKRDYFVETSVLNKIREK